MKKKQAILIVDDNLNFADRMTGLLREVTSVGDIHTATDYDETVRLLAEEKPDVVLLDINLPGKNGIEILRMIKKDSRECEVIMITNHADDYYRQQCYELGAKYFLDKSNDFSLVPRIISQRALRNNGAI
jgi:DNA-binding NarL/FixJ family response regulator